MKILNDEEKYENEAYYISSIGTEGMLQMFLDHGLIDNISGDYGRDVSKLCHNATLYYVSMLKAMYGDMLMDYVSVHIGLFDGMDHSWLQLGDAFIDPTLQQFVDGVPEVAIVPSDCTRYRSDNKMTPSEYMASLEEQLK